MCVVEYFMVCSLCCVGVFFFFKQKTAYEMRISDWSSDVCSSDLAAAYDVKVARASRLPTVSATADGGYIDYLGSLDVRGSGLPLSQSGTTAPAGVPEPIPLFQGRLPAAGVRQSQAFQSQSIWQAIEIEHDLLRPTSAVPPR